MAQALIISLAVVGIMGLAAATLFLGPTFYMVYFGGPGKAETIAAIEQLRPEWQVVNLRKATRYFSPQGGGHYFRVSFEGQARLKDDLLEFLDWHATVKLCGEDVKNYKSDNYSYYHVAKNKGDEVNFKGDISAKKEETGAFTWDGYRFIVEGRGFDWVRGEVQRSPANRIVDQSSKGDFCEKLQRSAAQ